jgi:RNA polymerase sigma factor (sigma-70 family)
MTDADLIEATRLGDHHAFAALVERHQRMVEAVAFAAAGDRACVDDVVQDAFLTAWRDIGRLRDPARLRPWLCGIARNVARKARRRHRREMPPIEGAAARTPFDDASDHEVTAALARLSARYREPLVLFYYERCTVKEVADALALREEAVMQRLSRGRKQLGEALADHVGNTLDRRPSRAALGVCLLALLPVRAASAKPSGAVAWLALHWRIPGALIATGIGAIVLFAAQAKSDEVAAAAAENEHHETSPSANSSAQPPTLPKADELDDHRYKSLEIAFPDAPAESCASTARALAGHLFPGGGFHTRDGHLYYEPTPEQVRLGDILADRAAADCGSGHWPEIYVVCEGTKADILAGNVSCYPNPLFD